MRIGLISDTHGLLRPEVFDVFTDVDHILHAGDVGSLDLLTELEAIGPVSAVWGNTDGWDVRQRLPEVAQFEFAGLTVRLIHGQQYGAPTAAALAVEHQDVDLVVFGHSHRPEIHRARTTVAVNPGSAGPARFKLPTTVAIASLDEGGIEVDLVTLVERGG